MSLTCFGVLPHNEMNRQLPLCFVNNTSLWTAFVFKMYGDCKYLRARDGALKCQAIYLDKLEAFQADCPLTHFLCFL